MGLDVDDGAAKRIGATLRDKWVLEELLGVGGMASVYAARHKIGRRDAIKILHAKVAESEQLRARFEQEAHAVNAFRHPGVVEIRDVDTTEDGAPFLVMELLEGETLAQRLAREHSVPPREMLEIAAQVLDVLAAAHARGIIHRDIKPDNLFLAREGKVKVLDFGIARVRSADKRALTTKAGVTLGTMAYMAPEQARGEEIDGRADVYAVGATIFRSLAGRIVHDADSQAALVMRVIAHGAPRLRTVVPDVSPDVAAVVDRALAFELHDRYPDAATMLADVRAVLDGKAPPYASTAAEIPERPRVSSLFDDDARGKPTVMPAKLQPQREATPANAFETRVGQGGLEPSSGAASVAPLIRPATPSGARAPSAPLARPATPSGPRGASAPTRVSREDAALAGGPSSASERVVIVPSRQGAVSVQPATIASGPGGGGQGSDVATVYGHAPPPLAVAQGLAPLGAAHAQGLAPLGAAHASGPGAHASVHASHADGPPPKSGPEQALTPFGELSAFVRKVPSTVILVVGGGIAVMTVFTMIVAIAWVASGPRKPEAGDPAVGAPALTATGTAKSKAPATATPGTAKSTGTTTTEPLRAPELPPPPPAARRTRR